MSNESMQALRCERTGKVLALIGPSGLYLWCDKCKRWELFLLEDLLQKQETLAQSLSPVYNKGKDGLDALHQ